MIKQNLEFNQYCKVFIGLILPFMLFVFENNLTAQEQLYINKETKQAYHSETRSMDGKPGKNYWQNTSEYKIKVKFTPETGMIEGLENITYFNNSPDTLKQIVIRLYQDLFKKGNAREYEVDPSDINNGINYSVKSNNETLSVNLNGTNLFVTLSNALTPKSSATLNIEWNFKIPSKTMIRMGTYDSTSFFLGQWYPQIAVYDDIRGWDTHSYNGLSEFYNDFGNFEVEISAPGNFVVWATGNLSNAGELLNEPYLEKFKSAINSDQTITIATPEDFKTKKVTRQNTWNTWKFKAENVSDFSFALSDHYVWEACGVEVDKTTKRRVFLQTAYNENHADYKEVIDIGRKTIHFLSDKLPGIPFPMPCMSIFDGADGMEYPMMTNVGSFDNRGETVYAQSHEITHTYLPFYVGTNETIYGWMDESMTVFLPEEIQKETEPTKDVPVYTTRVYSWYAGKEFETAVMTPTNYLSKEIYFVLNYGKGEMILRLLETQLGKEIFVKCLREFMDRWKYKHPTPYDFFFTFDNVSEQDLTWFWKPWYFEQGTPDLALTSAKYEAGKCTVRIKKTGTLPLPIHLQYTTDDGKTVLYDLPADIWTDGKKEMVVTREIKQKVTEVKLGNSMIPDSNPSDNIYKIK